MSSELQSLKPSHRHVMRLMALGQNSLKEICAAYNLNYSSWATITSTTLFKSELDKMVREIEDREIEQGIEDPIRIKLKAAGADAASRLVKEMDNVSENSSASARIKAAESILDRLGYSQKHEASQPTQTIILNVSANKLQVLQNIIAAKNLAPLVKPSSNVLDKDIAGSALQLRDVQPAVPLLVSDTLDVELVEPANA